VGRAMLVALLGLLACAEPSDSDTDRAWDPQDTDVDPDAWSGCQVGPPPLLQIGKGEDAFEPSETDDGHTVLIHGLQGGFHTFVSLRADHLATDGSWHIVIEGLIDGELRAVARLQREPDCNPDVDAAESIGTWLIWWGRPWELHEREVTIRAVVVDGDRRLVVGQTQQVIWDPELAE